MEARSVPILHTLPTRTYLWVYFVLFLNEIHAFIVISLSKRTKPIKYRSSRVCLI